ncbi:hypothetical protein GGR57DRAFT_457345 [Xylariaceae sp. FL1272]|nr:hypothetical protein GGR57DRAFT_457345 [Xylariaceae sp. FL1272]
MRLSLPILSILAFFAPLIQTYDEYVGCFDTIHDLTDMGRYIFQSRGFCRNRCTTAGLWVSGLMNGTHCLCGNSVPPSSNLVGDEWCNVPCAGYVRDNCGGRGFVAVYIQEPPQTSTPLSATSCTATLTPHPTAEPQVHLDGVQVVLGGRS